METNFEKLRRQLADAMEKGHTDQVRQILTRHPEMIRCEIAGGTLLHNAARCQSVALVNFFVELGCDVNAEMDNSSRDTPLFCALCKDNVAVTKALLEHGADPNRGDAIIDAITGDNKNSLELVKLLEKHGADIHRIFDFHSRPPTKINALSTAIDWGNEDVAEYLRSRGCVLPDQEPPAKREPKTLADEVIGYFEKSFGPVQPLSVMEIVPTEPRVVVHWIPAGEGRDCITLFTTGMSARPMKVPDGAADFQYAELFLQLPADWKVQEFRDLRHGWPIEWLRNVAQYPHINHTWMGAPATLFANGDPPEPLGPDVKFTTWLLLPEKSFTSRDGRLIQLYRMSPLYTEERELEIREDLLALMRALDRGNISFVVDLDRPNMGK